MKRFLLTLALVAVAVLSVRSGLAAITASTSDPNQYGVAVLAAQGDVLNDYRCVVGLWLNHAAGDAGTVTVTWDGVAVWSNTLNPSDPFPIDIHAPVKMKDITLTAIPAGATVKLTVVWIPVGRCQ